MRAAVLRGVREIDVVDVPRPERTTPDAIRVRIAAVGVCGSDVLRFAVGKGYGFPLVLGHELSGIVAEDAPDHGYRIGDRVAIFPCLPRNDDPMSEIGEYALGDDYDYFGSRRDGGLQEELSVPPRNLFRLPEHVSLIEGAMIEPAGVALHAVRRVAIPTNATALVIGAGPIGLLAAQWLRVLGAVRVVVADLDPRKRAIASGLGFETLEPGDRGTDELMIELTAGRGADIAVEASGRAVTLRQAITATAHRGQVVLLGDLADDLELPKELVSRILRRELTLLGTWNAKITPRGQSDWDMVIASIGRSVNVRDLVSSVSELESAPEVFAGLADRSGWSNKTIFAVAPEAVEEIAEFRSSASWTAERR
ncbi:galactitol-1-phosphate 5-dehydrogenase [Leucobacter allii]|uniref:Galactitol-1-phosphate 5-dehydrogenase n=1 Tax=Leucobacter allii TaxID=2932247 RepID=A0ABY4FNL4_9MICO|nr:galactitol-1-phosphate 5-dehydrogenase [Leucobacter allii]UOQ57856.1 galactitol-1-phosphate 5-dehydrogenase [Leucobacter allii]